MKLKLFFIFLFVSTFSFAQWQVEGVAQFTNNSLDVDITTDANDVPYIAYSDVGDGLVHVKKFDGTNWVNVGANATGFVVPKLLSIAINPVTGFPWVAYRNSTTKFVDIIKFDGTSWSSEVASLTNFDAQRKIILKFSPTGDALVGTQKQASTNTFQFFLYTKRGSSNWSNEYNEYVIDNAFDIASHERIMVGYPYHFVSRRPQARVYKYENSAWTLLFTNQYQGLGGAYANFKGLAGANNQAFVHFYDTSNVNVNEMRLTGSSAKPTNGSSATKGTYHYKYNALNFNYYGMFFDSSENMQVQQYKASANAWSDLSVGLNFTGIDPKAKLDVNTSGGKVYIAYLDDSKVTVKYYAIETPLSKYYVNANVTSGDGSGDSWANAMPELSEALNAAGSTTTEVWVAAGTYKPGTSRSNSFALAVSNLKVYGGFNGTESSITERNIATNSTILSGDLNGDDTGVDFTTATRAENSYHVVKISANDVLLDGFTIQDGHANGGTGNNDGSAISKSETANTLNLKNCIIKNNVSLVAGSVRAWYDVNGIMNIENCIFDGNVSTYASGIYAGTRDNSTLDITIVNSLFSNNTSKNNGATLGFTGSSAWIRANGSGSTITTNIVNTTFANNLDTGTQAALSNKGTLSLSRANGTHNATISNSIFYDNKEDSGVTTLAVTQGHVSAANQVVVNNSIDKVNFANLTALTNTSNANPLFVDAANNDFSLQATSPAINFGNNGNLPATIVKDLAGNDRINIAVVDAGAYEYQCATCFGINTTIVGNGTLTQSGSIYNTGDVAVLTATPDAGYQFDGWSGDASGTTNPLNITMNVDKNVTATFSIIQQTLTINATNGSVTTNPNPVNGTYDKNTSVALTAVPDAGYQFDGWSGDATGTTNPLSITMDADKTFTAMFSQVCIVNFTDTIFKNLLLANASVNTDNDTEIQCTEADAYTGRIYFINKNITSLDGIESFVNLTELFVRGNQLTTLDLTSNTSLTRIDASNNLLTTLILSPNMVSLSRMSVSNNPLASLDVSSFVDLQELIMTSTLITNIDVSLNVNLQFIEALNSNLSELDLRQNNKIGSLYLGGANVTSLDLRNGNLANIGYVETDAAPNLTCIFVDDSSSNVINGWLSNANNNFVETQAECTTVLSTDDFNQNTFNIYPNPVDNVLFIKMIDNHNFDKVEIYNLQGQKVKESNTDTIDVSNLSNGMYFIKVKAGSGNTTTKRFVKK